MTRRQDIWARLVDRDGCWEWTGSLVSGGYGRAFIAGRGTLIHRYVWEFFNGPVPDGLQLDHLCRNPKCANPEHLDPVTPRVNVLRGISQNVHREMGRTSTACRRGHLYADQVVAMLDKLGRKQCRACKQERSHSPEARAMGAARKRRQRGGS